MVTAAIQQAALLLTRFANRTGLTSAQEPRRYLWTDAFAVCTLLGLRRATGDACYEDLALRLVDRVHSALGGHRPDDRRTGWISGLSDEEGAAHPTRGGLRIGKPLPERSENEPRHPELEWDRDGQYFHYLTKWMHALDQVARATGRPIYNVWACELADVAHRAFTYGPPGGRRMRWKLSVDLSRPLVSSMGQHDPLDGLVTCMQLEKTAVEIQPPMLAPRLAEAKEDFAQMLEPDAFTTTDPLGLGGLLVDAFRLTQLGAANTDLVASILAASVKGLRQYVREPELRAGAHRRLAFRELGLAIGLAGVSLLAKSAQSADLAELATYLPLRTEIEAFWLRSDHRSSATWIGHQDINDVMLATSLAPEGFLVLTSPSLAGPRRATDQVLGP